MANKTVLLFSLCALNFVSFTWNSGESKVSARTGPQTDFQADQNMLKRKNGQPAGFQDDQDMLQQFSKKWGNNSQPAGAQADLDVLQQSSKKWDNNGQPVGFQGDLDVLQRSNSGQPVGFQGDLDMLQLNKNGQPVGGQADQEALQGLNVDWQVNTPLPITAPTGWLGREYPQDERNVIPFGGNNEQAPGVSAWANENGLETGDALEDLQRLFEGAVAQR
jgi:hypothetical protein